MPQRTFANCQRWLQFSLVTLLLSWAALAACADEWPARPHVAPLPAALDGVLVRIRQTENPQIVIFNLTPDPLTILDDNGRAFLRLDALGVHGDYATPAFHHSRYPEPQSLPNNAHGAPRWYAISASPSWGWFDPRLRAPVNMSAGSSNAWRIPVRLGDTQAEISGQFVADPESAYRTHVSTSDIGIENLSVHAMAGERPAIFLHNRGRAIFSVPGINGEPFLRFRPGKVMVNRQSPTWKLAAPVNSLITYSPSVASEPSWVVVSSVGGFGWADPRLQTNEDGARKNWSIPVVYNDSRKLIKGQISTLRPDN